MYIQSLYINILNAIQIFKEVITLVETAFSSVIILTAVMSSLDMNYIFRYNPL